MGIRGEIFLDVAADDFVTGVTTACKYFFIGAQDGSLRIDDKNEFGRRIEQHFQALLRLICTYAGGLLAPQHGVGVDAEARGKDEHS